MNRILLLSWVVAGAAQAQTPPPAQPPERPATTPSGLNLKLDEAARTRPSVVFGRDAGTQKDASANLPTLGGSSLSFDRPPTRSSENPASPFPKDTNPGM